jgi:hypothetical protein
MKRFATVLFVITLSAMMVACGPGKFFGLTITLTPTNTTTLTNTAIPTPTPTSTNTPTLTPTPLGSGNGEFLYQIYSTVQADIPGARKFEGLYSSERGILLSASQLAEKFQTVVYNVSHLSPSPDGKKVEISLCYWSTNWAIDPTAYCSEYLAPINLSVVTPLKVQGLEVSWTWSPDSSKLLGVGGNGTGRDWAYYVVNNDGSQLQVLAPLANRSYEGRPFRYKDSS